MKKRFLLLQGPHGPFFNSLGRALRRAGADVWRVGFNFADSVFWRGPGYIRFDGAPEDWPLTLDEIIRTHKITDIVCYGASRPVHRDAIATANALGLTVHALEEGYLRPFWVTYERSGTNATSPSRKISLRQMESALTQSRYPTTEPPDGWGDMRQHIFWGALYHAVLIVGSRHYPRFRSHRAPGVGTELRLYVSKILSSPVRITARAAATTRIRRGGFPYHIVLMQLAHDASFRDHGPFNSQHQFLDTVMSGFAVGAPAHHHLVVKAHPLEDGREPLRPLIHKLAQRYGLSDRVHFVSGGKLARLLRSARTAVTVNSTSAEQALWRGLPVRAFGKAVFNRPSLTSDQPLPVFYGDPRPPDGQAYRIYRAFLLATSQVPGGFYAFNNRQKLLRQLPDLMLADRSAYEQVLAKPTASPQQQLRLVS